MSKAKKRQCAVYSITCSENGKAFIAFTSRYFPIPVSHHRYYLRRGKHPNHHLQADWERYGEACFSFDILQEYSPDSTCEFLEQEKQKLIEAYNTGDSLHGYNVQTDYEAENANTRLKWAKKVVRYCEQCGKGFEVHASQRDRKFCSVHCFALSGRSGGPGKKKVRRRPPVSIVCKHCGVTFSAQRSTALFCGTECREAYRRKGQ